MNDYAKLLNARDAIEGPNKKTNRLESSVDIDWAAKNEVTVKVTQTYGGDPVENGEQTFRCNIDSGAFTLSLGPIFSKVQARQHTSTAGINQGGTFMQNQALRFRDDILAEVRQWIS